MTEIKKTFNVVQKEAFKDKLAELVRRYKVQTSVEWGEPYQDDVIIKEFDQEINLKIWFFPCEVTFSFAEFKIEGYTYLGCIKDSDRMGFITIHGNDLTEGLDISSFVNSFKEIPCHACNRKHSRKIGHLFQNDETKEVQVFGSACAKKYFGINFDRVLGFYETFQTRFDEWESSFRGSFFQSWIDAETLIKDAYWMIDTYGYVSASKAEESSYGPNPILSTKDELKGFYAEHTSERKKTRDLESYQKIKDMDVSILWEKDYSEGVDELTNLQHNIKVLQEKLRYSMISMKDFGMIAFMVWNEWFKPAPVEKKEYIIPEGFDVGCKIEKEVVSLVSVHSFEGFYGTTYINVFENENGDVRYKWFSSVDARNKLGDDLPVKGFINKATIKKIEDDSKYGKSIILTRVSLYEV